MGIKKLTKTKWREFFKKNFETKNVIFDEENNVVKANNGIMNYIAWLLNDRIYVSYSISNECFTSFYFNIDTFEYDWEFSDKQKQLAKEEQYEEWKSNLEYFRGEQ